MPPEELLEKIMEALVRVKAAVEAAEQSPYGPARMDALMRVVMLQQELAELLVEAITGPTAA